jgi:type IV secretory pathway VirB9-like protein
MTSKHTAQVARGHLYAAKLQAATTTSANREQTFKAKQRLLQDKARAARALAKQKAAEAAAKTEAEAAPAADAAPDAPAPVVTEETSPKPS